MNIKKVLALTLIFVILSGCSPVATEVVIEADAQPDESYLNMQTAKNSSATLREKQYAEMLSSGNDNPDIPVKPVLADSERWTVAIQGDRFVIDLAGDSGEFTVSLASPNDEDGIEWLEKQLEEKANMGFRFDGLMYAEDIHIFGDNKDAKSLLGDNFSKYFKDGVTTIIGYLGNASSVWEVNGYVSKGDAEEIIVDFIESARTTPWEE